MIIGCTGSAVDFVRKSWTCAFLLRELGPNFTWNMMILEVFVGFNVNLDDSGF